jgi:hypothetical protein
VFFDDAEAIYAIGLPGNVQQRTLGSEGRPPTVVNLDAGESVLAAAERVVRSLVEAGKIPPGNIAILTPTRSASELFLPALAGIPTQASGKTHPGKLGVETIHGFKGKDGWVVAPSVSISVRHHPAVK